MTVKDQEVWALYTRGIKPAKKKKNLPPPRGEGRGGGQAVRTKLENQELTLAIPHPLPPAREGRGSPAAITLERQREKALRQGAIDIDAKLDLHGLTQGEAFAALASFMRKNVKAEKRHLLIITGKGRDGAGVLRTNLKDWLTQLPESAAILALRPAAVQHGGAGAFYVLLRRKPR